ncbi:MAG: PAS domain-containing protein [Rhodobacter sp.]|nr:PAS domain-containing protein [Rhodobacter sp.]
MELRYAMGGNVVSFLDGAVARGGRRVNFPAIAQVDAYWEGQRAGRLMPDRSEIDPRGLERALEFAFVLEHIGQGVGRVRVAGMHLNDLLGMEVRGMPLTAFFAPQSRNRVGRILDLVISRPQVADITLAGERGIGRPPLAGRMYLAPLGNEGGGAPRILGCLQSDGAVGRAPRRFALEHVQLRRIIATAGPAPAQTTAQRPVMPGFAEPAARFAPTGPKRAHLRLVKNDG